MRPIIYPYRTYSSSARNLKAALQDVRAKIVRPDGRYRPYRSHLIINWGNSNVPSWPRTGIGGSHFWVLDEHRLLNHFEPVQTASNKLQAFQRFRDAGVQTPEWTAQREVAAQWMATNDIIILRHQLTGHSGAGIELLTPPHEGGTFPAAPLYVKYKKKKKEFRVHVFKSPAGTLEVIDVQQKRKRADYEGEHNYQVRNYHTGWIYAREAIQEPRGLRDLAKGAIEALGLDFGAIDLIWNERENQCYVLEVNTAPGLQRQTLTNYVEAIKEWL